MQDSVIDPRYHTFEEIVAYMDSIQEIAAYEAILDVREIGRSNNEDLPIYAVKLSANPTVDEDQPALLFLGQCHAEEILGVEITMGLIDSLLHGFDANNPHVISILQNLEVWVVPTYNPEGLRVVHDGLDVTYRKNKTDNNNNGIFDYIPGIGYDIDGVDFNRNYNFNWIFGDAYEVGDYDYYRGPAPFSESEVRAVTDLAKQEKFLLSVAYHSARSGTPEIIYYSWEWEDLKNPPDVDIMSSMANILGQRIINESGDGNYSVTPGKTPRGNAHDWFYTQTGAIQFLIEVGTNNLQPNADIIDDTVVRNLEGLFYLMDRAYGRSPESKAVITGIVTDAADGFALAGAQVRLAKLAADWSLTELEGLMMQPRTTDGFGRYRRLVNQGTYQVIASAPGFAPDTVTAIFTSDSYATILDFSLTPMAVRQIDLDLVQSVGIDQYEVIVWDQTQQDTLLLTPGPNSFQWPGDEIFLKVSAEGYFPEIHTYNLQNLSTLSLSVTLPPDPLTVYSTGFDDLAGWSVNAGPWLVSDGRLHSQAELLYPRDMDAELILADIDLSGLPDARRLGIYLKHAYEVEWHLDTLSLELWSADGTQLLIQQAWFDQNYQEHVETYFMDGDLPALAQLKLKMGSDSTVSFRGWAIDSLAIFLSEYEVVGIADNEQQGQRHGLEGTVEVSATLAPNPLHKHTELNFTVPESDVGTIQVFDIRGREIYQEQIQIAAGSNSWTWLGQDLAGHPVSTGVYFLRLTGTQQSLTRKLMVINKF
ncbi:MAG: carboxypeptidase regulatory-like domain-containing protein [Candidatus Marinimicrobia bacterium]|nr:carboxypeptidase regulatory-like domain-containing protein [Candidatus Neomarinimicrobiota bacterium]